MAVSKYRIRLMFSGKICPICGAYNIHGFKKDDYLFICKACDFSIGFKNNGFKSGVISVNVLDD